VNAAVQESSWDTGADDLRRTGRRRHRPGGRARRSCRHRRQRAPARRAHRRRGAHGGGEGRRLRPRPRRSGAGGTRGWSSVAGRSGARGGACAEGRRRQRAPAVLAGRARRAVRRGGRRRCRRDGVLSAPVDGGGRRRAPGGSARPPAAQSRHRVVAQRNATRGVGRGPDDGAPGSRPRGGDRHLVTSGLLRRAGPPRQRRAGERVPGSGRGCQGARPHRCCTWRTQRPR
jgi:hypothetical protein